jgi:hypothetical protein
MLIQSRSAQAARIAEKRQAILTWLKSESFSTVPILSQVLGTQGNACWKTLKAMERDGLVQSHLLKNHFGSLTIWGITPHGSAMATDPLDAAPDFSHFEPGRLSPHTLAHALDVQRVRLQLQAQGWTDWRTDRQCRQMQLAKVPDALAVDPHGQKVAVELERTIKTIKRYEAIMSCYLQAIRAGALDRVQYFSPIPGVPERLKGLFHGIRAVPVAGDRVQLQPQHYEKFTFVELVNG